MENKEHIADMLLKNGLATSREQAILLAERFQTMDQQNQSSELSADYSEESASISPGRYAHTASYEEDVAMQVSSPSFSDTLTNLQSSAPTVANSSVSQNANSNPSEQNTGANMNDAQRRLHATKVDISDFFNVNKMQKK